MENFTIHDRLSIFILIHADFCALYVNIHHDFIGLLALLYVSGCRDCDGVGDVKLVGFLHCGFK